MKITLAIVSALLWTVFAENKIVRSPIIRNPSVGNILEQVKRKHELLKRADDYQSRLYNDQGSQYLVEVDIGTPSQKFVVTLDTGSADLWVPSTSCPSNDCPYTRFNSSKSSTFKSLDQDFSIQYGIGSVNGTYVTDTVTVGGATVKDQELGLAYETEDIMQPPNIINGIRQKEIVVANGILGLGYPSLTQATSEGYGSYNPFVFNLVKNKVIEDPVFSIYLNSVSQPGWSGEIIFGGIDSTKYDGSLTYLPVASLSNGGKGNSGYYYWMVYGQGISVTNSKLANSTWKLSEIGAFILDTGTTLTYLPKDITKEIIESIAGPTNYELDKQSNVYIVDCSVYKRNGRFNLQMSQSGKITDNPVILSVPTSELIIPVDTTSASNASVCMFGIAPLSGSGTVGTNMYLVGDSVLRSAYMVYDMGQNRVGLAASKNTKGILTGGTTSSTLSENNVEASAERIQATFVLICSLITILIYFLC